MTDNYSDIINLPYKKSPFRPRMPIRDRAAQFSSFAALTGLDEAIDDTAQLKEACAEAGFVDAMVLCGALDGAGMYLLSSKFPA